jgi:hypothetical protein
MGDMTHKDELLEHLQRATEIVSTWPEWKQRTLDGKIVQFNGVPILQRIDAEYFAYLTDEPETVATMQAAAYDLATWLYAQGFMTDFDSNAVLRKRIMHHCPLNLYLLTLEYFLDGNFDP